MKLPQIQNADRYTGLYVVDFGDHSAVGFKAAEVAELLESSDVADTMRIYKIHRAAPDGALELKGVTNQTFELESGIFFYSANQDTSRQDYARLAEIAENSILPSKAKLHYSQADCDKFTVALIYPAELEDEFAQWLIDNDFRTEGPVAGGISTVTNYYKTDPGIIEQRQLYPSSGQPQDLFTGQELLEASKRAMVR